MLLSIHDKATLAAYFRSHEPHLHVYSIGDLDDFFWPYTQWYGYAPDGELKGVALMYMGSTLPNLLLLHHEQDVLLAMTKALMPYLPRQCYAHLSPGAEAALATHFDLEDHGLHHKMGLQIDAFDRALETLPSPGVDVAQLSLADLDAIKALYEISYPGNWFNPRMLETGRYMGIKGDSGLQCIAGIHVYSPTYRVAALGNITTHPDARGRGFARHTTRALCQLLRQDVDVISLNVKADNEAALVMYRQLGFAKVASYGEFTVTSRH